jgi:hypothetical protein
VVIINADANATHQSVIHVSGSGAMGRLIHITFATQTTRATRRRRGIRERTP